MFANHFEKAFTDSPNGLKVISWFGFGYSGGKIDILKRVEIKLTVCLLNMELATGFRLLLYGVISLLASCFPLYECVSKVIFLLKLKSYI